MFGKYRCNMRLEYIIPLCKRFRSLLLVAVCIFSTTSAFGQAARKLPLYFSFDQVNIAGNKSQEKFVDRYNVKRIQFIYQVDFAPGDRFDPQLLRKSINRIIPDPNAKGMVVLNWEGRAFKAFRDVNAKREVVDKYVEEFVEVLRIAKRMRPNIKWGYFGFPFQSLDGKNSNNISLFNKRLNPILKHSDFLCPGFYITRDTDLNNFKTNVIEILKYAKKFNKPVHATIWHRIHRTSHKTIPLTQFKEFVRVLKVSENHGHRVEKLFWWHEENHRYKKQNKSRLTARAVKSLEKQQLEMFSNYYKAISDYVY